MLELLARHRQPGRVVHHGKRPHRPPVEVPLQDQRRGAACAGTEISDGQIARFFLLPDPLGSVHKALGQQTDVESEFTSVDVERFFLRRKQIKKYGSEVGLIECARDKLITRTVRAAPAAVRKQDERHRVFRNRKATR